jgi:hypothetical protein
MVTATSSRAGSSCKSASRNGRKSWRPKTYRSWRCHSSGVCEVKRSTWILLVGLIAAGAVLAAGALNTARLQEQQSRARAACESPHAATSAASSSSGATGEASSDPTLRFFESGGKSTGDPDMDAVLAATECYAKLGYAPDDGAISAAKLWPGLAAAIIAILSALPCFWYFLLRRIAELRAAIGGNPPPG